MILDKRNKEQNFIEKRREWKSGVEKPLSRRTLLMALPALVLCVFVMMAAPYLKLMVDKFAKSGDELRFALPLNLEDEVDKEEPAGPPANPEDALLEAYRAQLEREGIDWRTAPQIEGPDLSYARERPIELAPLDVELPATMSELQRLSRSPQD